MTAEIPGITRAGTGFDGTEGTVWNILGQTYYPKQSCENSFAFEAVSPPGTFVPPHIHPTQDEYILMLEGTWKLVLDGQTYFASAGDLVRMPKGIMHGYFNESGAQARAFFWVSPGRKLHELFTKLHDLTDVDEVVRLSKLHEVDFLPPPAA
ncbi:cupin domain-containing protein [Paracraurococcus lichenis]|uniref:Cupin domain-containing protein n=1 Tax=Paracraurococcus lichenis TaxID=3064888 RepID=A0ABT9E6T0_9PROT|nr:cupin domain-containing protein [Paracraurococcus sp. LOR1-02]MDO9711896.1 cupin domain-containing protein [Paracraurococcus sp. LOR1-02]